MQQNGKFSHGEKREFSHFPVVLKFGLLNEFSMKSGRMSVRMFLCLVNFICFDVVYGLQGKGGKGLPFLFVVTEYRSTKFAHYQWKSSGTLP